MKFIRKEEKKYFFMQIVNQLTFEYDIDACFLYQLDMNGDTYYDCIWIDHPVHEIVIYFNLDGNVVIEDDTTRSHIIKIQYINTDEFYRNLVEWLKNYLIEKR